MNVKMNNLQLAVNQVDTTSDPFNGVQGTNEVTMGDPSINLAPKFETLAEKGHEFDEMNIQIDQFSVNQQQRPQRVVEEEEDEDTVGGGGRDPQSSSSSCGNHDEFDLDQEDEGLMLNFEDDGDELLIDGAGQETIEAINDIERMAECGKEQFFQDLMEEREMQMLSQESAYKYTNMKSRLLVEDETGGEEPEAKPKVKGFVIPPPNPLLPKQMLPDEPVKNGFLKKFIDLGKRPKLFEKERAPCGPVRLPAPKNNYNTQKSMGPPPTLLQPPTETKQVTEVKAPVAVINGNSEPASNNGQLTANQTISAIEDQSNPGNETSLRHFFYLEYRKIGENEKNPIVYSRFGKQHYDSEDKFNTENFSQLIRTCNIKRLLQGLPGDMNLPITQLQTQMATHMREYYRMKEECRDIPFYPPEGAPQRSYYVPKGSQDSTLVFESRFECGNLQLAHKQSEKEYNLILQNDINSKGHTQWFYFRVQNTRKGQKVKFNMLNLMKSKSLFNEGMKVLAYSEKKLEQEHLGWYRTGEDIAYYQNNYRREQMTNYQRCYHTFTFSYNFEYDNDTVFFAYSQPYSYSDLMDDIKEIEKKKLDYVSRNTLCRTLAGNRCDYLTITSRSNNSDPATQKKGVVISARVHPGESNSSWMMKGVIDYLISETKEAKELRDNFIFKIIPMLNPDGVINGNYRCSLAGCDLNRRWKHPSPVLHPTIYNTKQLIKQFSSERPLVLFCDLHGHSRRKNVFMYGNSDSKTPEAYRIFPYLMSKISGHLFSYDYSRFKVQRNKEQTARITLWKELKNPNIFTMEASFCGPKGTTSCQSDQESTAVSQVDDLNYHYTADDLMEAGKKLCETIVLYNNSNIDVTKQIEEIKSYHTKKIKDETPQLLSGSKAQDRNSAQQYNSKATDPSRRVSQPKKQEKQPQPEVKNQTETPSGLFNLKDIVSELKQKIQQEKQKRKDTLAAAIADPSSNDHQDQSSDEDSDSGESEDNLDADQLQQIMPKKIIKKPNQIKKKKSKTSAQIATKKQMKEDLENEKKKQQDEQKSNSQRRQSIRSLRDFKKPTQSFLQRYGLMGPNNRAKYLQPQKRDICMQTFENEEGSVSEVESLDVELSAMERDIMLCTGCIPDKIRRLAQTTRFEGLSISNFLHLIRVEASKLQGINSILMVRRDGDSLIIGRSSHYSLGGLTSPLMNKYNPNNLANQQDVESHRIKLDLSKVHDKFKDMRKTTTAGSLLTENLGLKNVQVLLSKQQNSLEKDTKQSVRGTTQHGPLINFDLGLKENNIVGFTSTSSIDVLNQVTNNLNLPKGNDSILREKEQQNNSSYDVTSSAYLAKKNLRVSENFRQDSTQSLKLVNTMNGPSSLNANGQNEPRSTITNKTAMFNDQVLNTRRGGLLQKGDQENSEHFGMQRYFNNPTLGILEPQIMPKSLINGPMTTPLVDLNTSSGNLTNPRSSSYQKKFADIQSNGANFKAARSSINGGTQKTPQPLSQLGLSQTQNAPTNSAGQRNQSNDSSLKSIWDSINRVAPPKILTQNSAIQTPMMLNQTGSAQNKLQEFIKQNQMTNTTLEKIDEKNPRSSSQGTYTTAAGKYQSIKTKISSIQQTRLPDPMAKSSQNNRLALREETLSSNRNQQNNSQTQGAANQLTSVSSTIGGVLNSGNIKKNIDKKAQMLKDRVSSSANQNQYLAGVLSRI